MSPGRHSFIGLALLLAAVLVAGRPASASVVLLDEHWSPEITANDVKVTEVDTEASGGLPVRTGRS